MSVRVHEPVQSALSRCDVIDCYSHYCSESEPAVGTPPPSALQQHQPRAAACSERRGCWYYCGERERGERQKVEREV